MNIEDIYVAIKPIKNNKQYYAQATLFIGNTLEIKGFRIGKSPNFNKNLNDFIWVQPPSSRTPRGWYKIVYITDEKLWSEIELKIYDEFENYRNKHPNEVPLGDEIDINKINI